MGFDQAYAKFMDSHIEKRKGDRLRRLKEEESPSGKLFLQQVWWPVFGHFENLHPEYQVSDFKDGFRYIDFALIHDMFKVAIELDGFGPHWRNISPEQFDDHLTRQNHLILDGWHVLRFSYRQIKNKPRHCQQTLQQLLGHLLGDQTQLKPIDYIEREIIRFTLQLCRNITPKDIMNHFGIGSAYARKLLHTLVDKNWLQPASGEIRIRSYAVTPGGRKLFY